jgi:hypothetical protein
VGAPEARRVRDLHDRREEGRHPPLPLGEVVRGHWKNLILGTFIMLATYVLFYLMTSFTLAYGTKARMRRSPGLGFGYTDFVIMQIIGVVFFGIFTLLSGPSPTRSAAGSCSSGSRR